MSFQRVRALVPVRHDGVVRIPGITSGENGQDFVVRTEQATRLIAQGLVSFIEAAEPPATGLEQVFVGSDGVLRRPGGGIVAGAGANIAETLARMYETEKSATSSFGGASFFETRTLSASETPTISASATLPSADTDAAAKKVVLSGNAGYPAGGQPGEVEIDLTVSERNYIARWISGFNQGMRARWRFATYLLANTPSSLLNDAGSGNQGNNNSPQFRINQTVTHLDITLDGDVLFIQGRGTGFAYQMWVNDKLVTFPASSGITLKNGTGGAGTVFTSTTSNHYIKIKFPTVARRNIRISSAAAGGVSDLYVRNTHTVRPRFEDRLSWLNLGDSFGSSSGGGDAQVLPFFGSGQQMAARFGRQIDFVDAHLGGSGFDQSAAGQPDFLERLGIDIPLLQPIDVITIMAAQNDTPAQIAANAPAVFAGLRARFPRAPIFVTPTYAPNSYNAIADKIAALRAAAAGVTGVYIFDSYPSRAQDRILSGSGRLGATTGDGTADRLLSSDGIHPAFPDGFAEWGDWSADQIYAQCLRGITL